MRKIMEVDVKARWDDPKEYTVVVPRDTLGIRTFAAGDEGSVYTGFRIVREL